MKKILALLLAGAMSLSALALAGCGEDESSADTATEAVTEAVTEAQSGPKDASWFDDAVFVGDSVTLKLSYYCENHPEALGNAQFFCAGSLGYASALWDIDDPNAVHPYYQGQIQLAENCAVVTGAKKVFVMLGMNDVALYGVDATVENCDALVSRILTNSPDVTVYIQSATPILMGKETGDFNNANVRALNEALKTYADGKGYAFIDLYSQLADENGYLPLEYCGDEGAQGIHFTDAACELWADYLKESV